jgi:type I restriction enzyme S subunit
MKDSGVEWIGEIPSHWEVTKFKYHSEIVTGNTPSKTDEDIFYTTKENGFPWVKPSSLDKGFEYVNESEEYLTQLGKNYTRVIPKDSIMVCSIGNTLGKFGISGCELSTNQQINSVVCDGFTLIPRFCIFFVSVLTVDLIKWTNFVTLPIFTKSDFENTEIIIPPLTEQQQIVSYLDEHTQLIDKTISIEERRIDTLKEYRQSLISEVVTGKRKVTTDE